MSLAIIEPIRQTWERKASAIYREAVRRAQAKTDTAALKAALEQRYPAGAVRAIGWDAAFAYLKAQLPRYLHGLLDATGQAYARQAVKAHKKRMRVRKAVDVDESVPFVFDAVDPRAVDWIRTHAGDLIKEWGQSSQAGLRTLMAQGFQDGVTVPKLSRLIRSSGIGITDRQALAIERRRQAFEDDPELTDDQVEGRTERYAARVLRNRCDSIARTETIDASSEGQIESWRQALDEGLLSEDDDVEWLANLMENTCPICEALDGQTIPLGEFLSGREFVYTVSTKSGSKSGTVKAPTAHTCCMCALGIR